MSEDGVPRRSSRGRPHRRVVAPATNASPEDAPDFTEPHELEDLDEVSRDLAKEIGTDEWWRAQRPPHWG
ncbi:hypothetical protein [Ornithinimicrobium cryptoxanthini]|uniref:Uncharacterized protein n=1 Tax=Ornithinimicrobium cryptoxanthini TaxID=2934161 RepID=A0ABY4YI46_9MICO|nr:hypothetical protein [Ornithinimicrobium cryptoxanthini]USQ75837.1 hypothetical protein NF557_14705 [Ornithinimicrobium cryptoxanthini]